MLRMLTGLGVLVLCTTALAADKPPFGGRLMIPQSASMSARSGLLVDSVLPDGFLDQAGLQPGDVILAIDGQPVNDAIAVEGWYERRAVGTSVRITFQRPGDDNAGQLRTDIEFRVPEMIPHDGFHAYDAAPAAVRLRCIGNWLQEFRARRVAVKDASRDLAARQVALRRSPTANNRAIAARGEAALDKARRRLREIATNDPPYVRRMSLTENGVIEYQIGDFGPFEPELVLFQKVDNRQALVRMSRNDLPTRRVFLLKGLDFATLHEGQRVPLPACLQITGDFTYESAASVKKTVYVLEPLLWQASPPRQRRKLGI